MTLARSRRPAGSSRLDEGILEPVEVLEPGARVEHLVDEGADLVEAADQQRGEAGEGDDVADAQFAVGDEVGADQQHRHHRDASRPGDAAREASAHQSSTGFCAAIRSRVILPQRPRLLGDAVVALQHGDVADAVADSEKTRW